VQEALKDLEQRMQQCVADAPALKNLNFQSWKPQRKAFEKQALPTEMLSIKRMLHLAINSMAKSYIKERGLGDKELSLCEVCEIGTVYSIVKNNLFDIGVGIAADGTFHASLFDLMGAKTINMGLSGGGSERTRPVAREYYHVDDLSQISFKRALVIEHDFLTGKTLETAFRLLKEHNPSELSLYLGAMSPDSASIPELAQAFGRIKQLYSKIYLGHDINGTFESSDEYRSAANAILRKYYAKSTAKAD
jgi:hypothetical protein